MRDLCKIAGVGVPGWVFEQRQMSSFLAEVVGVDFVDIQKSLAN